MRYIRVAVSQLQARCTFKSFQDTQCSDINVELQLRIKTNAFQCLSQVINQAITSSAFKRIYFGIEINALVFL